MYNTFFFINALFVLPGFSDYKENMSEGNVKKREMYVMGWGQERSQRTIKYLTIVQNVYFPKNYTIYKLFLQTYYQSEL